MRYSWAPIVTLIWLLAFACRPKDRVTSTAIWAAVISFGLILQFATRTTSQKQPQQSPAADNNTQSQQPVKPAVAVAIFTLLAAAIAGYIIWAVWL